ncbi:hypothetical protein GW17_00047600 [Ensete ventricosum]|nr:hypothetical protein GW17_00047600 [Ensete ventricosum]
MDCKTRRSPSSQLYAVDSASRVVKRSDNFNNHRTAVLFSKLLFFLLRIVQLHAIIQFAWRSHDIHPPVTRYERTWNGPHEATECVFWCDIDEGDEIRELRCRHLFHGLPEPMAGATCPLCRDVLLPREPATAKTSGGDVVDDGEDELDDSTMTLFAYLR